MADYLHQKNPQKNKTFNEGKNDVVVSGNMT